MISDRKVDLENIIKINQENKSSMDARIRKNILYDDFTHSSKATQLLFAHVPPFKNIQRERDQRDCEKALFMMNHFNLERKDLGVSPIDSTEILSCKRIPKNK